MGCIASFGKCIIILLNIVFLIIGIAFIAVGSVLRFFPGTLLSFLFAGLDSVTGEFEIGDGLDSLTDIPFVGEVGMALLVMGSILFFLAIIAFCGTCCKYRVILLLYIIILVIFLIVFAVVGALFIVRDSSLHTTIRDSLATKVGKEYKGPRASDGFTLTINILSFTLKCCGMSGPGDFDTPQNAAWKIYNHSVYSETIHVTPACCKQDVLTSDKTFECAKLHAGSYNTTITNTQGCYDTLQDLLQSVKTYAIIALVVIIALLFMLAIFGILLFVDMSDNKVGHS